MPPVLSRWGRGRREREEEMKGEKEEIKNSLAFLII